MPTYENVIPLSQASFSGKLPRKPHNQAVRSREYLTEAEVGKLMKAARATGRHGHRDATLILIAWGYAVARLAASVERGRRSGGAGRLQKKRPPRTTNGAKIYWLIVTDCQLSP